jgi:hypothetical protein
MSTRSRAAPKTANSQARQFRVSREGQSLRSMTVASLRKAILSLHFKPGEKLTERELCELTAPKATISGRASKSGQHSSRSITRHYANTDRGASA